MKKISLLSLILLTPFLTFGISINFAENSDEMCVQSLQSAINANGECKVFSTPCEVPEDWKKVNSCGDFIEESNIPNIDEVTKRRHESKWEKLREKAQKTSKKQGAKNARSHKFLRKSRSFVKYNFEREDKEYDRVRGTSKKNWNSKYRKLVSPARQKMLDEKEKLNEIKSEARQSNKRRRIRGSATMAVRTGKLSNKFWSMAAKSREKRQRRFSQSSDTIKKALRSRQPFRKAKKKPQPIKRHAHLRKVYKGGSFRGNLSGEVEVE